MAEFAGITYEAAHAPDAGQQVISRERTEEQVHTRVVGVPEGAHGDLPRHTTRWFDHE
jgi:hypothetical protein